MSSRIELGIAVPGRAAKRVLAAGTPRVFAAFERSCYVETATGIACVGAASIGLGPLNAIVGGAWTAPAVGDWLHVSFEGADPWVAPRVACVDAAALGRRWPARRPQSGLAPLCDAPRSLEPRLRDAAQSFAAWLDAGAATPAPEAAAALIGLGPGLTPAGDDFVGGALIALRLRGETQAAGRVSDWALALAATRTSRISRAHLACAAAGEGHAALHALLAAADAEAIEAAFDALDYVGHSSGWDAAAGALLVLRTGI